MRHAQRRGQRPHPPGVLGGDHVGRRPGRRPAGPRRPRPGRAASRPVPAARPPDAAHRRPVRFVRPALATTTDPPYEAHLSGAAYDRARGPAHRRPTAAGRRGRPGPGRRARRGQPAPRRAAGRHPAGTRPGARLGRPPPTDRLRGWLVAITLALVAGVVRFAGLGQPDRRRHPGVRREALRAAGLADAAQRRRRGQPRLRAGRAPAPGQAAHRARRAGLRLRRGGLARGGGAGRHADACCWWCASAAG